jgi:hypothetical protein
MVCEVLIITRLIGAIGTGASSKLTFKCKRISFRCDRNLNAPVKIVMALQNFSLFFVILYVQNHAKPRSSPNLTMVDYKQIYSWDLRRSKSK